MEGFSRKRPKPSPPGPDPQVWTVPLAGWRAGATKGAKATETSGRIDGFSRKRPKPPPAERGHRGSVGQASVPSAAARSRSRATSRSASNCWMCGTSAIRSGSNAAATRVPGPRGSHAPPTGRPRTGPASRRRHPAAPAATWSSAATTCRPGRYVPEGRPPATAAWTTGGSGRTGSPDRRRAPRTTAAHRGQWIGQRLPAIDVHRVRVVQQVVAQRLAPGVPTNNAASTSRIRAAGTSTRFGSI